MRPPVLPQTNATKSAAFFFAFAADGRSFLAIFLITRLAQVVPFICYHRYIMDKICSRCRLLRPLDCFRLRPGTRNLYGVSSECRECERAYRKENGEKFGAYRAEWLKKNREKQRSYSRRYYEKNREKRIQDAVEYARSRRAATKKIEEKYRRENALKVKAREAVRKALREGTIKKLPCSVCESPLSQAHHPDYSKPLDVVWLCTKHHGERHRLSQMK